jgi:hypothetical protein
MPAPLLNKKVKTLMYEALVITPVKDSLNTTIETIRSIKNSNATFYYIIYNDFSSEETTQALKVMSQELDFELVNLSEITNTPSPNYRLVLQMAQLKALQMGLPLIIVESDVEVRTNTISELIQKSKDLLKCGMVGSITRDLNGTVNFPYLNFKNTKKELIKTRHSLSFCCTLLTSTLLEQYDFKSLSAEKHWYDVSISRKSTQLGLNNYLLVSESVLHKPHSSRPWKQLKYKNPIKYYYQKLVKRLDKI